MSLSPRAIAAFSIAVAAALAGIVALPTPYPEGVAVERATGKPTPGASYLLDRLRAAGSLGALAGGLRSFAAQGDAVARGLQDMVAQELAPPAFDGDTRQAAPVESFFAGVDARAGLDARAATMQRRLQAGERPPLGELLGLARQFRGEGRERGELRWLQRALRVHPDADLAADRLLALFLAHGQLEPALALVQSRQEARAHDVAWQRHAVQLGAWLGRPEVEIAALERLCARSADPADRSRLIELYAFLGQPDRALPHAIALVDAAEEVAAAEAGASSVLRAGLVDEGMEMLRRAAARATAASPWWQRVAHLAQQDLRVGEAAAALQRAAAADGELAEADLEALYRRTDQPEQLADLLERRLARTPTDARLWHEVLTLRHALGQHEAARTLAAQRDIALADQDRFVAALPPEERASARDLRQQALRLSLESGAESHVVGETLERLRAFLAQPGFRALAESLLARYPHDPRAKPMRRELVDLGRSPAEAERAAAALSATYPDDVELARLWLQRAQWAENAPAQVEARRRVLALAPDDRENRHELADLLEYTGRTAEAIEHWRVLVAAHGIGDPAVPRLIASLQTIGAEDEAVEWLHRLARDGHASLDQRLLAAEELLHRRRFREAASLYEAVLAERSDHRQALLRMGQMAAWGGQPRAAVPFLERCLAAGGSEAEVAMVRYQLGEALWQLGEDGRARGLHDEALRTLRALAAADADTRRAVATMLDRTGRTAEAVAVYRELVTHSPRDADLVLDYADLLLRHGDVPQAGAVLAQAEALAPTWSRTIRLRAEVAERSGDLAGAERALLRALELGPADPAIHRELAWLRLGQGAWEGAADALQQWLDADPSDPDALRTDWQLRELLADHATLRARFRRIGEERHQEVAAGALHLFDERHWVQAELAAHDLRGPTTLAPGGEASSDFVRFEAMYGVRQGQRDRLAVGLQAAPGAEGDTAIGLHAAGHWEWQGAGSLQLQARWHELWMEPAAAAALGGRRSGIDGSAWFGLGERGFASVGAGIGHYALDDELGGGRDDVRGHAEASAGFRWLGDERAVATWFAPNMVPAGPESPFLAARAADAQPWAGELSLAWRSARTLGDSELVAVLPVAENDDQLLANVRLDHHFSSTLGAAVTGYAGADLRHGEPIHGVAAAVTWRPSFGAEFTLEGSRGETFGRSDDDVVEELHFQVVLRW